MQRTHVVIAVAAVCFGVALPASTGCRRAGESAPALQAPQPSVSPVAEGAPATAATPAPSPTPARTPLPNPVDFQQLVALIPELPGWTRTSPRGMQTTAGIPVAEATAEYTNGESTIKLEIIDSAFNDLVLAPLSTMLGSTYGERTPTTSRQYAAVGGSPGFESWHDDVNEGDVTVVVARRYVVTARGLNVGSLSPVRALVQAIDLDRLAALK